MLFPLLVEALLVLLSPLALEAPSRDNVGASTATIHWQRLPLKDAVERLEDVFGGRVFVDRRVDPNRRLTKQIEAASLHAALARIDNEHLGVCPIGEMFYFGPLDAARRLPSLCAAKKAEAMAAKSEHIEWLSQPVRLTWPRLAEPRVLIQRLVAQSTWRLEHDERIPHDLWDAGELRGMTASEALSMLLVGFDLSYELDSSSRQVRIVPIESIELEPTHSTAATPKEAHSPATEGVHTKQVYTLRVKEQPVELILRELGRRLGWKIEIDERAVEAAELSLEKRVSFSVESVDADKLLKAVLQPAGLTFRRQDDRILITPAMEDDSTGAR